MLGRGAPVNWIRSGMPAAFSIGWILFQARHYDEAIRELRSALAVHPDSANARFYLGFALIGKGQPQEAIPELERTVSLMHRSPGSVELLATADGVCRPSQ